MEQISHTRRMSAQAVKAATSDVLLEEYSGYDDGMDDVGPSRMPSSARRYRSDVKSESGRVQADVQSFLRSTGKNPVPPRRTARTHEPLSLSARGISVDTEDFVVRRSNDGGRLSGSMQPRGQVHWLVYVGLMLMIMVLGGSAISAIGNWWQVTQDDWHYGRPRTYQVDQVVGHNDSPESPSHFIALNLNRHVQVIEFPGGDGTKAKIYVGPILTGQGQDLAPVTLTFKDVNKDGRLDMIINVQDSHFVFINDNGQFRVPRQDENG